MSLIRCCSKAIKTLPAGFIMNASRSDGSTTFGMGTLTTPSSASSTGFIVTNYKGSIAISTGTMAVTKIYEDGTYSTRSDLSTVDVSDCAGIAYGTTTHSAIITYTA